VHITGYYFLDHASDWEPAPELEAFLAAGEPPVYIGFGSMSTRDPEKLAGLMLDAIAGSGQRAVLLTGWGGLQAKDLGEDVYVLDRAPHSWLFPRMAAVVHHGGAGTTAEGVRAGVPTVILPFAFDQAFWGARVTALDVGPDPIPQKKLTVEGLTRAIRLAATDPALRQRAKSLGAAIRSENGVEQAIEIVKDYFGQPDGDQRERSR
jgi:UDP:flavonoid glycosyltransferase YjiC (YdhE family)